MITIAISDDGKVSHDVEQLSAGLTSTSDRERCFARAVAGGVTDPVLAWADAELRRGTEPAQVLMTLMEIVTQQVASFAGNLMPTRQGHQVCLDAFKDMIDSHFLEHAGKVTAAVQEMDQSTS